MTGSQVYTQSATGKQYKHKEGVGSTWLNSTDILVEEETGFGVDAMATASGRPSGRPSGRASGRPSGRQDKNGSLSSNDVAVAVHESRPESTQQQQGETKGENKVRVCCFFLLKFFIINHVL